MIKVSGQLCRKSFHPSAFAGGSSCSHVRSRDKVTFVSVNRFEKKKKLELAILAFAQVAKEYKKHEELRLVMAGMADRNIRIAAQMYSWV